MATYRYSKYDKSPPPPIDVEPEYESVSREVSGPGFTSWLFRDPLRGWLDIDKFPYRRAEGEVKLDFAFKSVLYVPTVAIGLVEFPLMALCGGLWVGINYLRRFN